MTRRGLSGGLLGAVFFFSGVAGLGYEVVWGRWLHLVFGASAWALAAILSAFMAGLALGSFLAGRWVSRLRWSPLLVYGVLELSIGAWALLLPRSLDLAATLQGELFFRWVEHHTLYGLIRFGSSFLILLVPTSLMGATYPLLSAYVARRSEAPTRWAGLLYGLNTLGAVVGTVLSGFVLVPRFGLAGTNLLLVGINLGVGLAAVLKARGEGLPKTLPQEREPALEGSTRRGLHRLILAVFLANGVFNLAYEVLWARVLALIIGTTTYALSVMLAVFLGGIALGSLWMTRRMGRLGDPLGALLWIQAGMALWVLASPLLVNLLPYLFLRGLWALGIGWASSLALKCVLTALLLLPLTLGMGAIFPLGIQLAFRGRDALPREVGDLYAVNTAGGILGAFAAGFLAIPLIGVERALALAALGHFALLAALFLATPGTRRLLLVRPVRWAVCAVAALVLPLVAHWEPLILASGVYFQPRLFYDRDGRILLQERMSQAELLYHKEGASATVDVLGAPGGFRALAINGKAVATSNYYDYRVQRLLGVLPLLLHPEPQRVLVVGLGTGMTAGTGSIDPATESLEIVEITGEVVDATEYFPQWNLGVVHKPFTRVIVEDATHYLRFVDRRYDVVTSDPIHPFVTGAGDLYSTDNYRVAKGRLAEGGVFCQWVPLYQLSRADVDSILRTFDEVWDDGTVWVTGKDFILCAAQGGYGVDFATLASKAARPAYEEILRLLGFWRPEELFSAYVGELRALRPHLTEAVINTVERPYLEFSAPRAIFLTTDARNLQSILESMPAAPPRFLGELPAGLAPSLSATLPCKELVWAGFIADRSGDLAAATRLSRRAYDRCPELGYVRHFAAHTIQTYAAGILAEDPQRALGLLRRARELDPYTPEIAATIEALEPG